MDFTKGIKGFITKYGGVASHMAIRCAEFEIPAAIGCGEKIYDYVTSTSYLDMDCRNGKIEEGIQYKTFVLLLHSVKVSTNMATQLIYLNRLM